MRTRSSPRTGLSIRKASGCRRRERSNARRSSPPAKRHKSRKTVTDPAQQEAEEKWASDAEDESDSVSGEGERTVLKLISVARLWDDFYLFAFKALGQLACKAIAKVWIKTCHDRKQTSNPYNGRNTRQESLRDYGFQGAFTAPSYWPPFEGWENGEGCRHREPDHILKSGLHVLPYSSSSAETPLLERLFLLRHLLCCGHPDFTLDKLRSATSQIRRDNPKHFTAESVRILKQIYKARAMEIQYEKNEIGDMDFLASPFAPSLIAKQMEIP